MRYLLVVLTALIVVPFTATPAATAGPECFRTDQFKSTGAALFSPTPLLASLLGLDEDAADVPLLLKLDRGSGTTSVCLGQPISEQTGCFFPNPACTYTIPTEMTQLDLKGGIGDLASIKIAESEIAQTTGAVTGAHYDPGANTFFGGFSFFDVFYDMKITTPLGDVIRGTNCVEGVPSKCKPFRVEADLNTPVTSLPPTSPNAPPYTHPYNNHSLVWDTNGQPLGSLISGCHKPYQNQVPGHRICVLASGQTTDDGTGTGTSCLRNAVQFGVVDVSGPSHVIVGIAHAATGVAFSPWLPTIMNGEIVWTSSATTGAVPCSPASLAVSATYSDAHASPTVTTTWRQHH